VTVARASDSTKDLAAVKLATSICPMQSWRNPPTTDVDWLPVRIYARGDSAHEQSAAAVAARGIVIAASNG
jgi:hypothetical protein